MVLLGLIEFIAVLLICYELSMESFWIAFWDYFIRAYYYFGA